MLDEPSAGLHPADTESLLAALGHLKKAGNSLFVVEHELDITRQADWIVDVGPGAGEQGGEILYSGTPEGLKAVERSQTATYLFGKQPAAENRLRTRRDWLKLKGVTRNNLNGLSVSFPLRVFITVTGVSGAGKSSLVSQVML